MAISSEQTDTAALSFAAIQAVTSIFTAADIHDWAELRSRLADRVRLDWTSLNGGDPAELTGEQVTEAWRGLLSAFDATHHQLGSFLVDEINADEARLRFYGTATHVLAVPGQDGRWVLGGRYNATLRRTDDGWRAIVLKLTVVWGEGNQNLLTIAADRASRGISARDAAATG